VSSCPADARIRPAALVATLQPWAEIAEAQHRRLLDFAMARAARAGARRALLDLRAGNREARALYASLGFMTLGVRREYYREPTEDALVLAREPCGRCGAES